MRLATLNDQQIMAQTESERDKLEAALKEAKDNEERAL